MVSEFREMEICVATYEVKFCTLFRYVTTCKKVRKGQLQNEYLYFRKCS